MWSKIDGSRFPYTQNTGRDNFPTVGSVFNGNIHWLVENEESMDNIILAFDTTERELVEMSYPDNFKLRRDEDCDLCISGEFFSLWAMDYYNGIVEIWVMREYKVHSSWTKTLVLPIDNIPIPFEYISRICSTKSGNIVLIDDAVLAMYNNKGQLLEYGFLNQSQSSVTAYTESLLSLPSNNVQALEGVTNDGQDWQIV